MAFAVFGNRSTDVSRKWHSLKMVRSNGFRLNVTRSSFGDSELSGFVDKTITNKVENFFAKAGQVRSPEQITGPDSQKVWSHVTATFYSDVWNFQGERKPVIHI